MGNYQKTSDSTGADDLGAVDKLEALPDGGEPLEDYVDEATDDESAREDSDPLTPPEEPVAGTRFDSDAPREAASEGPTAAAAESSGSGGPEPPEPPEPAQAGEERPSDSAAASDPTTIDHISDEPGEWPGETVDPESETSGSGGGGDGVPDDVPSFTDYDPADEGDAGGDTENQGPSCYSDDVVAEARADRDGGPQGRVADETPDQTFDEGTCEDPSVDVQQDHRDRPADATQDAVETVLGEDDYPTAAEGRVNPDDNPREGDVLTSETPGSGGTELLSAGPGESNASVGRLQDLSENAAPGDAAGTEFSQDASYQSREQAPGGIKDTRYGLTQQLRGIEDSGEIEGMTLAAEERAEAAEAETQRRRQETAAGARAYGDEKYRDFVATKARKVRQSSGDRLGEGGHLSRPLSKSERDARAVNEFNLYNQDHIKSVKQQFSGTASSGADYDNQFNEIVDTITESSGASREAVERAFAGQLVRNPNCESFDLTTVSMQGTERLTPEYTLGSDIQRDIRVAAESAAAQVTQDTGDMSFEALMGKANPNGYNGQTPSPSDMNQGSEYNPEAWGGTTATVKNVINNVDGEGLERVYYLEREDQHERTPDLKLAVYSSHNSPPNRDSIYHMKANEPDREFDPGQGDKVRVFGRITLNREYQQSNAAHRNERWMQPSIQLVKGSEYEVLEETGNSFPDSPTSSETDLSVPDGAGLTSFEVPMMGESDDVSDAISDAGGSDGDTSGDETTASDVGDDPTVSVTDVRGLGKVPTATQWAIPKHHGEFDTDPDGSLGFVNASVMTQLSDATAENEYTQYWQSERKEQLHEDLHFTDGS